MQSLRRLQGRSAVWRGQRRGRWLFPAALSLLLAACAAPSGSGSDRATQLAAQQVVALAPTQLILFGEQHDSPEQHRIEREIVQQFGARGRLAALAIEMAEEGRTTEGLPRDADEAAVRRALGWDAGGWPWADYGPAIMAAVRFGVPVLGANLPRARMRAAMEDAPLDALLDPAALDRQREAIRSGHCGLLPESQLAPMTRIQLARDRTMAQVVTRALRPDRTVLLIAGAGHVRRDLGVPRHLTAGTTSKVVIGQVAQAQSATRNGAGAGSAEDDAPVADLLLTTPALPPRDACAALR